MSVRTAEAPAFPMKSVTHIRRVYYILLSRVWLFEGLCVCVYVSLCVDNMLEAFPMCVYMLHVVCLSVYVSFDGCMQVAVSI